MRLLLDTHVFLWFISGDRRLPVSLQQTIRDPENKRALPIWLNYRPFIATRSIGC
jgi:PIN domain nuclease of toxin-antitoxin system